MFGPTRRPWLPKPVDKWTRQDKWTGTASSQRCNGMMIPGFEELVFKIMSTMRNRYKMMDCWINKDGIAVFVKETQLPIFTVTHVSSCQSLPVSKGLDF